jgi:hypothetical protein
LRVRFPAEGFPAVRRSLPRLPPVFPKLRLRGFEGRGVSRHVVVPADRLASIAALCATGGQEIEHADTAERAAMH